MNTLARFEPRRDYHIYNRTNNKELLFRNSENRRYFLNRLNYFLKDYVKFYAYSLLPNHFHLLIKVRSIDEIIENIKRIPNIKITKTQQRFLLQKDKNDLINDLIVNQFLKFFTSYSKGFNKIYKRNGNLFARSFKRSLVYNDSRLMYWHYYIIHNARKHNIVSDFRDHQWNSFLGIINEVNWLVFDDVISLFGGKAEFVQFMETEENGKILFSS
ncbi:hypothetical protein [Portibacter lacus]|uniref:Transposase IS200-like domain-containing protein n=1 Tax=Portibacter lacus TaxID=1099794 RepID=A0AA37WD54_9BACT|nr:hypothetical protein [Portibacter lacus]GLR15537.1 hypothetical protein GCM10007940_01520 [Portibacter lacus]